MPGTPHSPTLGAENEKRIRLWLRDGLTDLEAPDGSDAPAPADVIKEILRERQHISKLNAGRALATLEPHLLDFQ